MDLDPQTEQQLADMSDEDWSALTARVRPPTSSEQLKTMAAKRITDPDQLNAFMSIANPKALITENGDIDEAKLGEHLGRLFGPGEEQPPRQWGQHSAQPAADRAGEAGKRALKARHGVGADSTQPAAGGQVPRGRGARAELQKRYGGRK